jgi:SulP family sulfate permease
MPRLARYRVPIGLNPSLLHYQRGWLTADLSAGLTVGALTIPAALGYAEVAGLPPVYGLYAAMVPMALFALFGSSGRCSCCSGWCGSASWPGSSPARCSWGS